MSDKKNDNYDLYTEHIVKEPWKNSKYALVRTMYKTNGVTDEE